MSRILSLHGSRAGPRGSKTEYIERHGHEFTSPNGLPQDRRRVRAIRQWPQGSLGETLGMHQTPCVTDPSPPPRFFRLPIHEVSCPACDSTTNHPPDRSASPAICDNEPAAGHQGHQGSGAVAVSLVPKEKGPAAWWRWRGRGSCWLGGWHREFRHSSLGSGSVDDSDIVGAARLTDLDRRSGWREMPRELV